MKKLFLMALMTCLAIGVFAQTPFTCTYTFGNDGNVQSFTYNGTTYDGIDMGNIEKIGVTTSSNNSNFRATNWSLDTSGGIDTGKYIGFTISAQNNYKFTVSSITFGIGRSATGTRHTEWRGSADSYAAAINSYTNLNSGLTNTNGVLENPDTNGSWTGNVLSLGANYQDIESSCGFRIYLYKSEATSGTAGLQGPITIVGTYQSITPTPIITVSPSTLSGFSYTHGSGPSTTKNFTVSGSDLSANINISAPTNYEIKKDGDLSYGSTITLTQSGGSISSTTINVRLKAGLAVGNYNSETISVTSTGATTKTVTCSGSVTTPIPSIEEVIVPQYIQGINGTNNERIPWASRLTLKNLTPNSTYRYYCGFADQYSSSDYNGAGNLIFVENPFKRSENRGFSNSDHYSTFITDEHGAYTGWFMGEPTANNLFTPGNALYFRIMLNNGDDGTSIAHRLTTDSPIKVINFGTATDDPKHGTFLYDTDSGSPAKNFVFVYDNEAGTGRPIAGTVAESDGLDLNSITSILPLYKSAIDGKPGAWGVIIPNFVDSDSFGGIKRIESWDLQTGNIHAYKTSETGIWSDKDTTNPSGTPINLSGSATLPVELSAFTATLSPHNKIQLTWVTQTETGVQGFYVYRGVENELATAILVSDMIEATNTSQTQVYVYEDKELYEAGIYYYWLQSADMDGSNVFYGPVTFQYGGEMGPYNPGAPYRTILKTVYPNPFNPSTRIPYELANGSNVDIRIYNTRGQLVRSFPLGSQPAGYHYVNWDGKNERGEAISSGIYFIKMQVNSRVYSSKALMLK